ncbi:MAG: hypothetical protein L3J26_13700 [Candidatus Polarisedimenticolaceae bacterium]|nr:hypothetical protein [Candidatus Polarisedimenticolaceae bacterium]
MEALDFHIDFRIHPRSLGFGEGSVETLRIHCGTGEWAAPGSFLLRTGADELFTVWDGVFFLLRREGGAIYGSPRDARKKFVCDKKNIAPIYPVF